MKWPDSHRRAACVRALHLVVACLALAVPAQASAEIRTVTGLQVASQGRAVTVTIGSPGAVPLTMRSFPLRNPARLVFDLQDASLRPGLPESLAVSGAGVTQLRLRQFSRPHQGLSNVAADSIGRP